MCLEDVWFHKYPNPPQKAGAGTDILNSIFDAWFNLKRSTQMCFSGFSSGLAKGEY